MMLIVSDGAIVVTSSCSVLLPAVLAFFSLLTVKNRVKQTFCYRQFRVFLMGCESR